MASSLLREHAEDDRHRKKHTLMAEIIFQFAEPLAADGIAYGVRACGRPTGTIWEGWLEFEGADGTLVTPRETTQPDRRALEYWASGLSPTYFEGAFLRAISAEDEDVDDSEPAAIDMAMSPPAVDLPGQPFDQPPVERAAVLDPYSVGAKGRELLRSELGALSEWHLRNIIRAYALAGDNVDLEALPASALVDLIVDAVIVA